MKIRLLALAIAVLLLAQVACRIRPTANETDAALNLAALQENLREAGATIIPGGEIEQPFFSVGGHALVVNGADVQVFEYRSQTEAKADAALVAPGGNSVGTSMMTWMAAPHFFQRDRLIVLYVGEDLSVVSLLETVLGAPFAPRAES